MGKKQDQENFHHIMKAMEAAGEIAYQWNVTDDSIEWLGSFDRFLEQENAETPNSSADLNLLINSEDLLDHMRDLKAYLRSFREENDLGFDSEFRIEASDGKDVWVHDSARAYKDKDRIMVYGVLRRLHAMSQSRKDLKQGIKLDRLTGFLKRGPYCEYLNDAYKDRLNLKNPLEEYVGFFAVIGIDRLGMYNEAFGADTANRVIKAAGQRVEDLVRLPDSVVSRIGGDRFSVFIPNVTAEDVDAFARQVLASFSTAPLITPQGPLRVSVSIGSAKFMTQRCSAMDALTRAETAMQVAKEEGRGCYVPYSKAAKERAHYQKLLQAGDDFLFALNGNRVVLAYQPIVDAKSEDIVLQECLVRMVSPKGELVSAYEFIPAVEQLGLSRTLDQYVIKRAISDLTKTPDLALSVNVSAYAISDNLWMEIVEELLAKNPEVAERLVVEITESVAMKDLAQAQYFVNTLKSYGIRIALDDFGAGHTSFSQMQLLDVDIVKIDKSFIKNINVDTGYVFISALKQIAETCNLKTIAEGAETEAEAKILREEGIDMIQGHVYGKPEVRSEWKPQMDKRSNVVKAEAYKKKRKSGRS